MYEEIVVPIVLLDCNTLMVQSSITGYPMITIARLLNISIEQYEL